MCFPDSNRARSVAKGLGGLGCGALFLFPWHLVCLSTHRYILWPTLTSTWRLRPPSPTPSSCLKNALLGTGGCSPAVTLVLSMCETLASIPSVKKKKVLIFPPQSEGILEWEKVFRVWKTSEKSSCPGPWNHRAEDRGKPQKEGLPSSRLGQILK